MVRRTSLSEVVGKITSYRSLEQAGHVHDGVPALREDRQVGRVLEDLRLPRAEIAYAMLDAGLVAPALERDGIALIGGGGPGGSTLYIKSQQREPSRRFGLPDDRFVRMTDVLPELSQHIPPMTDEEATVRVQTLQAIAGLGELTETLRERGKRWFSLGDSWRTRDDGGAEFWLNPLNQAVEQFGWYTLAELQEWAKGSGPVVKSSM